MTGLHRRRNGVGTLFAPNEHPSYMSQRHPALRRLAPMLAIALFVVSACSQSDANIGSLGGESAEQLRELGLTDEEIACVDDAGLTVDDVIAFDDLGDGEESLGVREIDALLECLLVSDGSSADETAEPDASPDPEPAEVDAPVDDESPVGDDATLDPEPGEADIDALVAMGLGFAEIDCFLAHTPLSVADMLALAEADGLEGLAQVIFGDHGSEALSICMDEAFSGGG